MAPGTGHTEAGSSARMITATRTFPTAQSGAEW